MQNYLSYFIISFITSSLSTSYINTLYQKNIKSITDELNLQFEENRKLKEKINFTCDKILNTMKNERINSTDSFESFDKLSD